MKFFNWMQSKFSAGQGDKRVNAVPPTNHERKEPPREDHGLLAIGTFGYEYYTSKQQIIRADQTPEAKIPQENESSSPDFAEFTAEEVSSLHEELTKLLRRKPADEPIVALPLDRFLNCPSSLEVDRTVSGGFSTHLGDKDEQDIDRTIRIILGRCNDVIEKKKAIGKKSFSFLVKRLFVCTGGFVATPGLRDAFQESRMEKLLRTMLTKKMHPQNSFIASPTKKCRENYRHTHDAENKDSDKSLNGSKWDKTDSEYIVLEI